MSSATGIKRLTTSKTFTRRFSLAMRLIIALILAIGLTMALRFGGRGILVTFFNVNAFFSRGLADMRGLFDPVPLLMVLLVPALTMRLWAEEGAACLQLLNGMFALAVWDGRRCELSLARDRFGIKPLYLCRNDDGLAFASELRGLRAGGGGGGGRSQERRRASRGGVGDGLALEPDVILPPRGLHRG